MARRSDHTHAELRVMIVAEGHRQMSEIGFVRFSAREVAKRIGYSIGTIYNVMGTHDILLQSINGVTLDLWRDYLETRLSAATGDRLRTAIEAYFEFAILHRHAWMAVFDYRFPEGATPPEDYAEKVAAITKIVIDVVAEALPAKSRAEAPALARSLLASVHGHCDYTLNGTFQILGEADPLSAVHARVMEAIAARQ